MISCEKAADICTKAQYNEATFLERLKLKFHLIYCKVCAAYAKQNTKLTSLCSKANLRSLSETEKEKMKETIRRQG
ncbi:MULTISPECIES: hypothetical protein [Maribacter]|uniref:Glycine dehydrogenase n=1 Tax=Maribacter flavus TaxID=1658664 RepID=A0A5B2TWJ8_9FLAO|nr:MULTISPECIES: hypothetical protein [Maribacter]KAA2218483.1 hypothetical protein F0361_02345 [Maribacter flavus]MDC6404812.1 hypothetical protein [Maribacter sp. PR66]MEE1972226.1 hypothetical protein [Maribacter flavus]